LSESAKHGVFIVPMIEYSVIIPTCNRPDLLRACLQCLISERQLICASRYQIIVSNDGDDTSAYLSVCEENPDVVWVKGPGKGPAANRNYGASMADTPWLIFLDDDCLPEIGWLAAYDSAKVANGCL